MNQRIIHNLLIPFFSVLRLFFLKTSINSEFVEINIDKIFLIILPIKKLMNLLKMLLNNQKRLKIQGIIKRIAQDKSITLEERIYVEKFANHNSTISLWLKKANSFRRNGTKNDNGIDNLLQSFGIDGLDKENHFNPNEDDISDWFGGAPDWLRRS